MTSRRSKVILTEARDLPCLRFLWRWKLSSTFALARKFYPEASLHTAYKRLLRLEHGGFIHAQTDPTASIFVWTLTQKGFQTIRHLLPPLKEEGYKYEHLMHDWLVSAIHLGDLLIQQGDSIGLISDQELRRVEPDYFPGWVPKSTVHRPDGYTRVGSANADPGEAKTIALEVELHLKRNQEYELIRDFYLSQKVHQVLWVVPKESAARRIQRIVTQGQEDTATHSFILLEEVLKNHTRAAIRFGKDEGTSIGKCLYQSHGTDLENVPMSLLLNARKSPHKSKRSPTEALCGIC